MSDRLQYPFGKDDIDTLIVCHGDHHMLQVARAFQIKARYVIWGQSLAGSRYKKIIAFRRYNTTPIQDEQDNRYFHEQLRTKLLPGFDEIFVV